MRPPHNTRQHRRHRQAGKTTAALTVMELLVVMALLVTLVAMLFPTVRMVSSAGLSVRCVRHLQQSGVAMMAYAAEHQGVFPLQAYSAYTNPTTMRWNNYLDGTVAGKPVYLPKRSNQVLCPAAAPNTFSNAGYVYGTIGFESPSDPYDFPVPGSGTTTSRAVRLSAMEQPARYWLLADSWAQSVGQQIYIIRNDATNRGQVHLRHRGKANLLFADGHVSALGPEELRNLPWHPLLHAYNEKDQLLHF